MRKIKVTPFSIGGASGDALYVYIDGRKVLSGREKMEIENRVNNYDQLVKIISQKDEMIEHLEGALADTIPVVSQAKQWRGEYSDTMIKYKQQEERIKELEGALKQAQLALEVCYDVVDYPCNGSTRQDKAIKLAVEMLKKGD